jgi:hypothetical protein
LKFQFQGGLIVFHTLEGGDLVQIRQLRELQKHCGRVIFENDVTNQGVERIADQTRRATLNEIDTFWCRDAARLNPQSLQQNGSAEKFDDTVDAERF